MTTIDTNVLVRALMSDGSTQAQLATQLLRESGMLAVPLVVFCETAWVLRSRYSRSRREISIAFERILNARNITCDREAVQFGIAALITGADFADAVIALEGRRLGAASFVSFDRHAVRHVVSSGIGARLLAE